MGEGTGGAPPPSSMGTIFAMIYLIKGHLGTNMKSLLFTFFMKIYSKSYNETAQTFSKHWHRLELFLYFLHFL